MNDSKTHMMILTTSQMRRSQEISVQVQVGMDLQETSKVEKLLGLQLHEGLKFQEYIMSNDKSLIKTLKGSAETSKSCLFQDQSYGSKWDFHVKIVI